MMENEVRLIDANGIVKVAERAYHEWCLAMVGADDTRKVDEVFKKQYLCKVVKAVAENCPTIDPESLRPKGRWIEKSWRPECSLCGFAGSLYDTPINPFKFCPNCGAKMEG